MEKLYELGGRRTYLVASKKTISRADMIELARKEFRVRADQVCITYAEPDGNGVYSVELDSGSYWCATRNLK